MIKKEKRKRKKEKEKEKRKRRRKKERIKGGWLESKTHDRVGDMGIF